MRRLRRFGWISGLVISTFLLLLGFGVAAADNDTVAATVTVQNIAVSVADGSISYGILAVNQSTGTVALTDTQVVTNDSNIAVDVDIRGYDSAAWSLAGTAGNDQYVHQFCSSSCATPPTNYSALTTSYATLAAGVAAAGTVNLDLYLTTPTVSSSFTQQNVDVSVLVTEP